MNWGSSLWYICLILHKCALSIQTQFSQQNNLDLTKYNILMSWLFLMNGETPNYEVNISHRNGRLFSEGERFKRSETSYYCNYSSDTQHRSSWLHYEVIVTKKKTAAIMYFSTIFGLECDDIPPFISCAQSLLWDPHVGWDCDQSDWPSTQYHGLRFNILSITLLS